MKLSDDYRCELIEVCLEGKKVGDKLVIVHRSGKAWNIDLTDENSIAPESEEIAMASVEKML